MKDELERGEWKWVYVCARCGNHSYKDYITYNPCKDCGSTRYNKVVARSCYKKHRWPWYLRLLMGEGFEKEYVGYEKLPERKKLEGDNNYQKAGKV